MIVAVRRLVLAALVLLAPTLAAAQTYTISPSPFLTVLNNAGAKVSLGCVWTYTAGTTTPATTYTTSTGVANTNPIIADSAGRFTAFLAPGSAYKFVYENIPCSSSAHGSVLRTADNLSAIPSASGVVDITGTAGESITVGQAVYLSDGSGSKTAGQWYKADNANTYSSTTNWVGIATVSIASAGTGTIRIAGSVTGLSALALGTKYYVGTAGALTSTANGRLLGEADTATSLVLTGNPPLVQTQGFVDDFRLSLTTATPVTTSDVTAATTLYLTPYTGNRITLFDTSGNVETCTTAEISIAVPASTSQLYDVWAYDSTFGTCAVTLELLAWTNDTTRATAIAKTSGSNWRYTKSGNTSRMYVGSMRTTTVSGQTEHSATKRYVWNYYNRVRQPLLKLEATVSWTYTTATWRQANAAAANQVDVVIGVAEAALDLSVAATSQNSNTGVAHGISIGEDSTSVPLNTLAGGSASSLTAGVGTNTLFGRLSRQPAVGRHFYAWLEFSAATGTTTWLSAFVSTQTSAGLSGWIEG